MVWSKSDWNFVSKEGYVLQWVNCEMGAFEVSTDFEHAAPLGLLSTYLLIHVTAAGLIFVVFPEPLFHGEHDRHSDQRRGAKQAFRSDSGIR